MFTCCHSHICHFCPTSISQVSFTVQTDFNLLRFSHLRLYWVLGCISLELYLLWQISLSLLWQLLFLTAVHLESESIILSTAFFNMVITVGNVWKLKYGNGNVTSLFDALKCYYIVYVQWGKSWNNCYSTFGLSLKQTGELWEPVCYMTVWNPRTKSSWTRCWCL